MTSIPYEKFLSLKKAINEGKAPNLKIASDSMTPLIKVGDLLEITCIDDYSSLLPFDIILFWQFDKLNCHFVFRVKDTQVLTKSLKNPNDIDYPVEKENVLGRVSNFNIGFFLKLRFFLRTLIG